MRPCLPPLQRYSSAQRPSQLASAAAHRRQTHLQQGLQELDQQQVS